MTGMAGTIEVLVPGGQANPGPPLGPELVPVLETTGRLHLVVGVLLAAVLLLAGPAGGG